MSDIRELIESTKKHITGIKRASNIVKKRTQGVVDNFLLLNNLDGLDRIPYLATRMTQVMTTNEGKGFKIFVEKHFPLSWNEDKEMFNPTPIKNKESKRICEEMRLKFLEEYKNNYWLWLASNVKVEKKEVDWFQRLDSAMNSLQDPEKGDADLDAILLHIIEKEGVNLDTFMRLLAPTTIIEGEVEAVEQVA